MNFRIKAALNFILCGLFCLSLRFFFFFCLSFIIHFNDSVIPCFTFGMEFRIVFANAIISWPWPKFCFLSYNSDSSPSGKKVTIIWVCFRLKNLQNVKLIIVILNVCLVQCSCVSCPIVDKHFYIFSVNLRINWNLSFKCYFCLFFLLLLDFNWLFGWFLNLGLCSLLYIFLGISFCQWFCFFFRCFEINSFWCFHFLFWWGVFIGSNEFGSFALWLNWYCRFWRLTSLSCWSSNVALHDKN